MEVRGEWEERSGRAREPCVRNATVWRKFPSRAIVDFHPFPEKHPPRCYQSHDCMDFAPTRRFGFASSRLTRAIPVRLTPSLTLFPAFSPRAPYFLSSCLS